MYREERISKLTTVLISAALTTALALIVVFKIGIVFETNDDATLRNIASGIFTGKPDAHLIYIMYPLGMIFKGLYTVAAGVAWYDLVMVGLHFICLFLILLKVGNSVKNNLNRIIALLVTFLGFIAVELKFFSVHQYTELAGLLGATALFYLGTHDYKKKTKADVVIIIILFVLTLWLRKQVLFLCLPFAALLIVLSIYETQDTIDSRFDRFKATHIPAGIFFGIFILSFVIETVAYSSDEWRSFKAFNEARTTVYDYNMLADYESNKDFYDSIDLSYVEYTVLREYGLSVMQDVDTDMLNAISHEAKEDAREWARYYSVPRKIINDTIAELLDLTSSPTALACLGFMIILIVISVGTNDRITALMVVGSVIYTVGFVAFFTYKNRLPERVSQGFFLIELLFLCAVLIRLITKKRNMKAPDIFWEILLGVFLLVVMGGMDFYAYRQSCDKVQEKMHVTNQWVELNKYFKSNQDKVYVINNSVFAAAGDMVFLDTPTDSFNVITGNWTLGGPLFEERNARIINSSVYESLCNDDGVFYVQKNGKDIEWLIDYFGDAEVEETVTLSDGASYDIISIGVKEN